MKVCKVQTERVSLCVKPSRCCQNIPSSGPPAASQAGSDPAAWCSEGVGTVVQKTHTGRVSIHAEEKKKKRKTNIHINIMSFEHAVQSRAGAKCISRNLFNAAAGLGSQAVDTFCYWYLHTHYTSIDMSSVTRT